MLAKLQTLTLSGIDALPVDVEIDICPGHSNVTLVGLPSQVVKESIQRVMRALENSGFTTPGNSILINLAPAEMHKQAASFDLPIAIGLLAGQGQVPSGQSLWVTFQSLYGGTWISHTQKKTQTTIIVCHKNEECELSSLSRVPTVT